MVTAQLVFAGEQWGATGSDVTGSDMTGSDVSHVTGSDVSHCPEVTLAIVRKYVLRMRNRKSRKIHPSGPFDRK